MLLLYTATSTLCTEYSNESDSLAARWPLAWQPRSPLRSTVVCYNLQDAAGRWIAMRVAGSTRTCALVARVQGSVCWTVQYITTVISGTYSTRVYGTR